MARRTPQAYAGIEQWLERRYVRRGVRSLYDCWCGQMAWTLLVFAVGAGRLTLCGELAVQPTPGAGTTVAGSVPLATARPTGGQL